MCPHARHAAENVVIFRTVRSITGNMRTASAAAQSAEDISLTRDELAEKYLKKTRAIARKQWSRMNCTGITLDDFLGAANLGLAKATLGWDSSKSSFFTYLWIRVHGEIADFCKSVDSHPRRQRARLKEQQAAEGRGETVPAAERITEIVNVSMNEFGAVDRFVLGESHMYWGEGALIEKSANPEEQAAAQSIHSVVLDEIRALRHSDEFPEFSSEILEMTFFQEMTMQAAAAKLGLSTKAAAKIRAKALSGLKNSPLLRALSQPPRSAADPVAQTETAPSEPSAADFAPSETLLRSLDDLGVGSLGEALSAGVITPGEYTQLNGTSSAMRVRYGL